MAEVPNSLPLLGAMIEPRFTMPAPVNRGREVPFNSLVPGRKYYMKVSDAEPMIELEFVERIPGTPRFRARQLPRLISRRNFAGNPAVPVYEPQAPGFDPNRVWDEYAWPHYKFYEISNIKRRGRFIQPTIYTKARRQVLMNALTRRGLSAAPGSGPANIVMKLAGMAPPRGTRGGKRKTNRRGWGKQRKTRRMRGGANLRLIREHLGAALEDIQKQPFGNKFFFPRENNFLKSDVLFIGKQAVYAEGFKNNNFKKQEEILREQKVAKFPYEECLFFFEMTLPDEEGKQYPSVPPIMLHKTAGIKNYRLHPNLYGYGEFSLGQGTDEKTCLGILNNYGPADWDSSYMTVGLLLQRLDDIFGENPMTREPGFEGYSDINPESILYNKHVLFESVDVTSLYYELVINAINADATTATKIVFNPDKVSAIPSYVKPFLEILARRAYDALRFLIGKLRLFIDLNGGKPVLHLVPPSLLRTHHHEKHANFGALVSRMEATFAKIPEPLRVNVIPKVDPRLNLYRMQKPVNASGKPVPYNKWLKNLEKLEEEAKLTALMKEEEEKERKEKQRRLAAAAAAAAAAAGNNGGENENEVEYVYENYPNNTGNENTGNGNTGNGNTGNEQGENYL